MAESSFPWTDATGDGGSYAHNVLDNYFEKLFTTDLAATEGVLLGDGAELACAGAATPVVVQEGSAVVKGKFYISTADTNVAVATPSAGHTRKDRIVLRANFTAMTIRITKISAAEDADFPAITQTDGTTWDLPLCKLTITDAAVITVVDERTFCHFGTAVNTAMIDALAVTSAKLAADSVITTKILDANVTHAKLAANAVETDNITAANVTHACLANDAVETHNIKAANVTVDSLAAAMAGTGLAGGAGSALSVNVDGSTIEINTDALRVKDAGITLAKLAAAIYSEGAFVWHYAGAASTGALTFEQVAPFAVTLTGGYIIAATAPAGAAMIWDVHSGAGAGTTVFTTQGNRPTLADGSAGPTAVAAPDVTAIGAGTRLVAAIDQIGSGTAGSNITLVMAFKKALV